MMVEGVVVLVLAAPPMGLLAVLDPAVVVRLVEVVVPLTVVVVVVVTGR